MEYVGCFDSWDDKEAIADYVLSSKNSHVCGSTPGLLYFLFFRVEDALEEITFVQSVLCSAQKVVCILNHGGTVGSYSQPFFYLCHLNQHVTYMKVKTWYFKLWLPKLICLLMQMVSVAVRTALKKLPLIINCKLTLASTPSIFLTAMTNLARDLIF